MNRFETTINGTEVFVDNILHGFELHQKASSNVQYFATSYQQNKLFVQFNTGQGYLYTAVPKEVLDEAVSAPSIGKFIFSSIRNKFTHEQTIDNAIEPIEEDSELEVDDLDW